MLKFIPMSIFGKHLRWEIKHEAKLPLGLNLKINQLEEFIQID